VRIVGGGLLLSVLAGCSAETLDPSPPRGGTGGSEADNPLLDDAPVSCEERKTAAEEHVLATVAGSVDGCTTDADCTLINPETGCYGSCPLAVATHHEEQVRRAAADANERWCRGFTTECSELVTAPPDCSVEPPRCDGGRCATGTGAD
jgi:hypothetical protein